MADKMITTGGRGCSAQTKRRGVLRYCQQQYIVVRDGKQYCFYHDPKCPHKFGERARVTRYKQCYD